MNAAEKERRNPQHSENEIDIKNLCPKERELLKAISTLNEEQCNTLLVVMNILEENAGRLPVEVVERPGLTDLSFVSDGVLYLNASWAGAIK